MQSSKDKKNDLLSLPSHISDSFMIIVDLMYLIIAIINHWPPLTIESNSKDERTQ